MDDLVALLRVAPLLAWQSDVPEAMDVTTQPPATRQPSSWMASLPVGVLPGDCVPSAATAEDTGARTIAEHGGCRCDVQIQTDPAYRVAPPSIQHGSGTWATRTAAASTVNHSSPAVANAKPAVNEAVLSPGVVIVQAVQAGLREAGRSQPGIASTSLSATGGERYGRVEVAHSTSAAGHSLELEAADSSSSFTLANEHDKSKVAGIAVAATSATGSESVGVGGEDGSLCRGLRGQRPLVQRGLPHRSPKAKLNSHAAGAGGTGRSNRSSRRRERSPRATRLEAERTDGLSGPKEACQSSTSW